MEKTSKFKAIGFGVLILVLFLLVQLIAGVIGTIAWVAISAVISGGHFVYEDVIKQATPILLCVSEVLCIIIFGIWYYFGYIKKDKANGTYISGIHKIASPRTLGFIVSATVAMFFLALLMSHLMSSLWPESRKIFDSIMNTALDTDSLYGMLTLMVLAPLAEEIAFRGLILRYFRNAFGITGCIILNVIMFAVMHLNPLQSLYVLPIGAMLTYLALKYDSVIPSMLAHILNNSISVLLPMILNRDLKNTETLIGIIVFGVLAIVLSDIGIVSGRKTAVSNA